MIAIATLLLLLPASTLSQEIFMGKHPILAQDFGSAGDSDIKDLEDLTRHYYDWICKQNGRSESCYNYFDLDGVKDKKFPFRRVKIQDVSNLRYTVKNKISKPSLTLSQDYCNSLSKDGEFTFKKTSEISSDCEWKVEKGFQFKEEMSMDVKIPELADFKFSESVQLSLSKTKTQKTSHKESWGIDTKVPVPSETYVQAAYTVIEDDFQADWYSDITFSGCTNVWFKKKIDGHWEWWHTVGSMFSDLPGFECWTTDDSSRDFCENSYCKFNAHGTYYGIGGAQAHLVTSHRPCIGDMMTSQSLEQSNFTLLQSEEVQTFLQ